MLAILVYAAAVAIPVYLLYRFRSLGWFWHLLAIAAAVAMGFVSIPPEIQGRSFDLSFGFTLVVLLLWGFGGLFLPRRHRVKPA